MAAAAAAVSVVASAAPLETVLQICYLQLPEGEFLSHKPGASTPSVRDVADLTEVFELLLVTDTIVVRSFAGQAYLTVTPKDACVFQPQLTPQAGFQLERPASSPAGSLQLRCRQGYVDVTEQGAWVVVARGMTRSHFQLIPVKDSVMGALSSRRSSLASSKEVTISHQSAMMTTTSTGRRRR
jgi:hypothetical protein